MPATCEGDKMKREEMLKKLNRINDLPTLPAVALEVNRLLSNTDASVGELTKLLQKDQTLSAKILRLVNSAFFGVRSKVKTIPHAVTLLGFNTVRNAVISVSVVNAITCEGIEEFNISSFWAHSVAVAVTGNHMAGMMRLHPPDDFFMAGLLHDIGKVVLTQHFQAVFKTLWQLSKTQNLSFFGAEKREKTMDHAKIGGYMAQKWQLPADLTDAVQYHHNVGANVSNPMLARVIHVADVIVNTFDPDTPDPVDPSLIHPDAATALTPQLETVSRWYPEISEEIATANELFLKPTQ